MDTPSPETNETTPAPRDLVDYLIATVQNQGSDLHLSARAAPMARIHGSLQPLESFPLDADACRNLILSVLNEDQRARLEEHWELDFALQVESIGRFRGNAHYERGCLEAAFRHIPDDIPSLERLGHPPIVENLCRIREGLILVTGVTGSGKSTTLASMAKLISEQRSGVIISIEDPIEYVLPHSRSLVKQREIGSDTHTFPSALKHVLRQDPDVIVVSELRDLETISTAITAAETGHLVLSTLHTIDAPKSLDRIIDVFPADQQDQIIAQLSNALQAVVSQRLIPRIDREGRILASEVMIMNPGIRAVLRQRRFEQLIGLMEIGHVDGMRTIDESLYELMIHEVISDDEVLAHARDKTRFEDLSLTFKSSPRKRKAMMKEFQKKQARRTR